MVFRIEVPLEVPQYPEVQRRAPTGDNHVACSFQGLGGKTILADVIHLASYEQPDGA